MSFSSGSNFHFGQDSTATDLEGLTTNEVNQLSNIDNTIIPHAQWAFLGSMDQNVSSGSNVQFNQVSATGGLLLTETGVGTDQITLQAPASVTAHTLLLPGVQGGVGTHLQNDGSGNLSWNTTISLVDIDFSGTLTNTTSSATWDATSNLAGFNSISGTTLTDGTASLTGGVFTGLTDLDSTNITCDTINDSGSGFVTVNDNLHITGIGGLPQLYLERASWGNFQHSYNGNFYQMICARDNPGVSDFFYSVRPTDSGVDAITRANFGIFNGNTGMATLTESALNIYDGINGATTRHSLSSLITNDSFLSFGGGSLGVGVTSPAQKLDVLGNIKLENSDGNLIISDYTAITGANNLLISPNTSTLALTTGTNNTIISPNISTGITTSTGCTVLGDDIALGGNDNTSVGYQAGEVLSTGAQNTFIGRSSGKIITTGTQNVFVGYQCDGLDLADTNAIAIGDSCKAGTNAIAIGDAVSAPDGEVIIGGAGTIDKFQIGHFSADISALSTTKDLTITNTSVDFGVTLLIDHIEESITDNGVLMDIGDSDDNYFITQSRPAGITTNGNSILIGRSAGTSITAASDIVAIGKEALTTVTTEDASVAIGYRALQLCNGEKNVSVGGNCLNGLTTGTNNVGLGVDVGAGATITGSYNFLAVGGSTALSSGEQNIIVGRTAGATLTTGSDNILLGYNSDVNALDDDNAVSIGDTCIAGTNAVAIGNTLTAGDNTVKIGNTSITSFTTGHLVLDMTAPLTGTKTLTFTDDLLTIPSTLNIDDGSNNYFLTDLTPPNITTASGNIILGNYCMSDLTDGTNNVAIGRSVLDNLTTGDGNIAIGTTIMISVTTAFDNVCIGNNSGQLLTGNYNTCVGKSAGIAILSGSSNTCLGRFADVSSGANTNAVALGTSAYAGSRSVCVGVEAESLGDNSIAIGYDTECAANAISIGYGVINSTSNTAVIGPTSLVGFQTGYLKFDTSNLTALSTYTYSDSKLTFSGLLLDIADGTNNLVISNADNTGSGSANTIIGQTAGSSLATDPDFNTLIGFSAGSTITNADSNTIVGRSAGSGGYNSSNSSFFGNLSGYGVSGLNTAFGYNTLNGNTGSGANTVIGNNVFASDSCQNSIGIGAAHTTAGSDASNVIVISGSALTGKAANTTWIGNSNTNDTYLGEYLDLDSSTLTTARKILYPDHAIDFDLIPTTDRTRWNDIVIPGLTVKTVGASQPTLTAWNEFQLYGFSIGDEAWFQIEMDHSWKIGSDLKAHAHVLLPSAPTAGDDIEFNLEYTFIDVNESYVSTSNVNIFIDDLAVTDVDKHLYMTAAADISGAGHTLSSILLCHLVRTTRGTDYSGDILLMSFDIHYELDTVGSSTDSAK